MIRSWSKTIALSLSTFVLGTSLAFAGGMMGTVTKMDDKGMATVKTDDGKEHMVKGSEGWKIGAKVECTTKDNKMECQPGK